jgi:hypothetical protein
MKTILGHISINIIASGLATLLTLRGHATEGGAIAPVSFALLRSTPAIRQP